MTKGSMREKMPTVAAFIDDMRGTFGAAYIDKILRRGISGEPVFFASEAGHSVGTPVPMGWRAIDQPPDPDAGKTKFQIKNEKFKHLDWGN